MLFYRYAALIVLVLSLACNSKNEIKEDADQSFDGFRERFMDEYWKENPAWAIVAGYGKYYDEMKVPDSISVINDISFSNRYLDTLKAFDYDRLSSDNKISYRILENEFRKGIWYLDTLKSHEWDPSEYNIGGECYELINRTYAPLDQRLLTLSKYLRNADAYYTAAFKALKNPTREHTKLAIQQNDGVLDIFGSSLGDSIKVCTLDSSEKDILTKRVDMATAAIRNYMASLQKILDDKNYSFRDYRIGEQWFNRKFEYEMVTDYTARQIFDMAVKVKNSSYGEMYRIAGDLWPKYYGTAARPNDSMRLIQSVIDKVSLQHGSPAGLFDTLNNHLRTMKQFIVDKDLFDCDTSLPVRVRKMPSYAAGFTIASAEFPPMYSSPGSISYYNMSDLAEMPAADAESQLREYNNYNLELLSIHEAVPGHCFQGIYNNRNPDIIKAVFYNGTMIEGWAQYCMRMMLQEGWRNNSPEMLLISYKSDLRGCCNVIIDYGIHCLNYSEQDVYNLLKNEAFQEEAQVKEKYKRATLSQVQLCSYFTGSAEIFALREAWKQKQGDKYSLKKFHEAFLSYGSSPIRYIREMMMQ